MFAGILCSSFNIASWQAFIQSAGIKNVQTRNNYILNKDKYLSWNNNSNISNILHLHLTWSHDSCPNPPVDVCTCAGHYNSFYSKICWLYGPASLFFPGRWNTNTRKWLPKLKINKFFDHLFSWHRKGAALGSKNFLLSCHITMVSAGTPECQLLKLDDVQLFSLFKPLGFQSMSIINMFEKTSTHGLILRSIMAQIKLQLFKRGFQAAKFCLLFL